MRPRCCFTCLVLFSFCPLARSEFSEGPDKCCFSFSKVKIPVKQVESYYMTHAECHRSGIIFITKAQRLICADPTEKWVQKLKTTARRIEIWAIPEMALANSKVDRVAKKAESIRMTETAPHQRPEETTLVYLIESNDWLDFDTTQANPNTKMASESIGTRGTTTLQKADESAVVHLKE
ncbi:C-C motif chemokine 2 isoform X2 [Ctenopharyngodon idella]|uniref:C-C motif chemokine n=2 Tax=Ctenopharyngodon idella TaxID=7959 RepID=A0A345D746_CTEID|nr:C-C motif chemokine 2 isoform X2 [Ctenopharyngodon idella]AXF84176.1 chemokine ligand 38 [Ctenopharyngodon idella]